MTPCQGGIGAGVQEPARDQGGGATQLHHQHPGLQQVGERAGLHMIARSLAN
jgi:hypothetical protein